ncbi:hypothetical protein KW798_01230 [Candidatus Parcubacteria bacterium]|nr:hypothetical protein [Candidatus Parcubacteria bacterium]
MSLLRTKEMSDKYQALIAQGGLDHSCVLCAKTPLKEFTYWKIIPNDFPYDKVAKTHHMLIPKRHSDEKNLTKEENEELWKIKPEYINDQYDYILEATSKHKSIPAHFHLHLLVVKDELANT